MIYIKINHDQLYRRDNQTYQLIFQQEQLRLIQQRVIQQLYKNKQKLLVKLPGGFSIIVINFPYSAFFYFSSETGSSSGFDGLLFFKEGFSGSEFSFGLSEVRLSFSKSFLDGSKGFIKFGNKSNIHSFGSSFVSFIFSHGSFKRFLKLFNFIYNTF